MIIEQFSAIPLLCITRIWNFSTYDMGFFFSGTRPQVSMLLTHRYFNEPALRKGQTYWITQASPEKFRSLLQLNMQQQGGRNPVTLVHDVLKEITRIHITSVDCACTFELCTPWGTVLDKARKGNPAFCCYANGLKCLYYLYIIKFSLKV